MAPLPSPFVLVPGAGGDAWYWSRVVPLLEAAGHEAIAVDLPAEDERVGLEGYADLVVEAIGDLRGVTLVAQSLGGFSAPLAVGRADVARLLLVTPMIPAPGESASEWFRLDGQNEAGREQAVAEGRDPEAPFDEREAFFHDVDDALADEACARPGQGQADKPFTEPFPLDAWPPVPTGVLLGRQDRILPVAFLTEMCRDRLGIEPDTIDAGHLAPLSQPRAVADWLLRAATT